MKIQKLTPRMGVLPIVQECPCSVCGVYLQQIRSIYLDDVSMRLMRWVKPSDLNCLAGPLISEFDINFHWLGERWAHITKANIDALSAGIYISLSRSNNKFPRRNLCTLHYDPLKAGGSSWHICKVFALISFVVAVIARFDRFDRSFHHIRSIQLTGVSPLITP